MCKCSGDRCQYKHDESKKGTGKRDHDGGDTLINQVTKKMKDELRLAINEIKESKKNEVKESEVNDWTSMLTGIYMINLRQKDKTIKIHKFDKFIMLVNSYCWTHGGCNHLSKD